MDPKAFALTSILLLLGPFCGSAGPIREGDITVLGSPVTCELTYGFFPCTNGIWGQLFLFVVYQYLLSVGGRYVSDGSDIFFGLVGPGIFGASMFYILGTFPQISLILVSGLLGSDASAQMQAEAGISVLAGSAVMNLTLIWASIVAFGSVDLSDDSTSSKVHGHHDKHSIARLAGYGVSTDLETSHTARIMLVSMIPFIILQLPKILNSTSGTRVAVLVSLIISLLFFLSYVTYQIFQPWIQNRRFEYLTQRFVKNKLLSLLSLNGRPNVQLIREIFKEIDKNGDGFISAAELRLLLVGIQLEAEGSFRDDYVDRVMDRIDISGDNRIEEEEFVRVLSKWLVDARKSLAQNDHNPLHIFKTSVRNNDEEQQQSLVSKRQKSPSPAATPVWWNYFQGAFLVITGTAILAVLAAPLVQTVVGFATAANIPPFFIPYVVIPLSINFSMAQQAIASARQKTQRAASLTLSLIYDGVFMNNMVSLIVFLSLVYIRDLSWNVSAEFLVVMLLCTLMGLATSFRTVFPFWTSLVAYLLYPLSLLLLYLLTYAFGWSLDGSKP